MSTQTTTANVSDISPAPGQHIILDGISWETYERLVSDCQDSHAAHLSYDRGVLEIMVLSFRQETINRTLAHLVSLVAEELQIDTVHAGSTTFKRQDIARGFEPDSCSYIQHEGLVSGKTEIDLSRDPPPDLVIEIDISSSSLNKFPVYARMGVPEVWRCDGTRVFFFVLSSEQYESAQESRALPSLSSSVATEFLEASTKLKSTAWTRRVREWARQRVGPTSRPDRLGISVNNFWS